MKKISNSLIFVGIHWQTVQSWAGSCNGNRRRGGENQGSYEVYRVKRIHGVHGVHRVHRVHEIYWVNGSKENWKGGGDWVSVHFAVTFLDCWRTSFCVTTIIKIVNNNTNDKQTSGASLALDEDSPYTNWCLFTLDRLPLFLLLCKN